MKIYAVVPARSGSKGVARKNTKSLAGFPLIAYSVVAALNAEVFERVFVSTDAPEIANLAAQFGAEVPFLRPAELAQEQSADRGYVEHALDYFRDYGAAPDALAIIRPTTPIRDPVMLREAVRLLITRPESTALRSVHPLPEPPQKMMGIANGWLTGLFPDDRRTEYYNLPRQAFPPAYHPNGYVDIVTSNHIRESSSGIFGPRVLALITPVVVELDTIEQFDLLEFMIARKPPVIIDLLKASCDPLG